MNCDLTKWALALEADISSSAKFLLVAIASRTEDGRLVAGQAEIARIVRLTDRQVRTLLKQLEAVGLIKRERRGGQGAGRLADVITINQTQPEEIATSQQMETASAPTGKSIRTKRKSLPPQTENISAEQAEVASATKPEPPPISAPPMRDNSTPQELNPEPVESSFNIGPPRKILNGSAITKPAHILAGILIDTLDSPSLNHRSLGLHRTCGEIAEWMAQGADFDADIVPTVADGCVRKNGEPIRSWRYFRNAVLDTATVRIALEQRAATAQIITPQEANAHDRNGTHAPRNDATYGRRKRNRHSDLLMQGMSDDPPDDNGWMDSHTGK